MVCRAPLQKEAAPTAGRNTAGANPIIDSIDRKVLDFARAGKPPSSFACIMAECLPLVRMTADSMKKKYPLRTSRDDLISSGTVGLGTGLIKYEIMDDSRPSSYLRLRIRGEMFDLLRSEEWHRHHVSSLKCGISLLSIDDPDAVQIPDNSSRPDFSFEHHDIFLWISNNPTLTERERRAILLKIFEDVTLDQIGAEFGLSRPRVCTILGEAFGKISEEGRAIFGPI
jgi:RNA polymerase sigma factor (sigma-70 family)